MIKPTRVILVRHGETEANLLQIWHGSLDAPLTERGKLQVEATAQRFADCVERYPIQRVYVSPLPRAQSTAAAIGAAINLKPVIEEGLREFSIGDWEGRTYRDLMDNEQLWRRWAYRPAFCAAERGVPQLIWRARRSRVQRIGGAPCPTDDCGRHPWRRDQRRA